MAAVMFTLASLLQPVSASAKVIKATPPSTPGNFHVTGTTTSSVSLAWTASKAGSDSKFVYEIVRANDGYILNFGSVTSGTWNVGLQGGQTYSFYIFAIDSDNNKSANSSTVTVTLPAPPPPPPPPAPVVSLVSVTPTTITVEWPAVDLEAAYVLYVNGVADSGNNLEFDAETEWTVINLAQGTTYTITVEAVDFGGTSPMSNPVTATTTTTTNTIAPTAPTGLTGASDGGGEAIVSWNPSTSPYESQSQIEYLFYVNGMLEADADTIGQTIDQYVFPNGPGDPQQVYVVAVDQYGNVSPPSNILTIDF